MSSRLSFAMKSMLTSFGQVAAHSPWLVQAPKPSRSIVATMFFTLSTLSGCPWGKNAICDTFAEVNNMAEALGQDATQAPQPMH